MAQVALGVIGLLLGVASIPMMEQFYADKINAGEVYTNVKVGTGSTLANESSYNTGGHKPNIALWGNDGHRIGRYRPHKSDYVPDGTQTNIKVHHGDTEPENAAKQPEYILLTMNDDDAICVNYVAVTGPDNNQMGWYGDVGFTCGADWYHSQYKIGANDYMPRCTWIDKDHTNGLRFQGMGIHMTDFNSNSGALAKQYQDVPDSMCKTSPRFKMYESIGPDGVLPIYWPPLNISPANQTDADPQAMSSNQGIPGGDPGMVTPQRRAVEPATTNASYSATRAPRKTNKPGSRFDGHLIVSHHAQHSAIELCESDYSVGADFASIEEEQYCDMYTKDIWPICTDSLPNEGQKPKTNNSSPPSRKNMTTTAEPKKPASHSTKSTKDPNDTKDPKDPKATKDTKDPK
ncbi:hypothetical protein MMC29_006167, partial [Sticta canariensis]|nr:hypothetical protein [Sticta canariensis]